MNRYLLIAQQTRLTTDGKLWQKSATWQRITALIIDFVVAQTSPFTANSCCCCCRQHRQTALWVGAMKSYLITFQLLSQAKVGSIIKFPIEPVAPGTITRSGPGSVPGPKWNLLKFHLIPCWVRTQCMCVCFWDQLILPGAAHMRLQPILILIPRQSHPCTSGALFMHVHFCLYTCVNL